MLRGTIKHLTDAVALYSQTWTTNPELQGVDMDGRLTRCIAGDSLTTGVYEQGQLQQAYYNYQVWVEVDYTAGGASVKPYYYYLNQ